MTNTQNITLTGFMGTGKSTIGELLARRLGRQFVDMDALIEQREGRPIPQIFTDSGEPHFRQLEADLCRELAGQQNLVIATGGGALIPAENLRVMAAGGPVVCLDCEPQELWRRIGQSEDRPMLADNDADRFSRLQALLAQRSPAYARIEYHLDVTHLSPLEAVEQLVKITNTVASIKKSR